MDFQFDIIGLTETKITKTTCNTGFDIPGYTFEYVATSLASGGVALFINEDINYTVLERVSREAFQALWVEISLEKQKNVICGIIYRQVIPLTNSLNIFYNRKAGFHWENTLFNG